jgi:hypothetical protein
MNNKAGQFQRGMALEVKLEMRKNGLGEEAAVFEFLPRSAWTAVIAASVLEDGVEGTPFLPLNEPSIPGTAEPLCQIPDRLEPRVVEVEVNHGVALCGGLNKRDVKEFGLLYPTHAHLSVIDLPNDMATIRPQGDPCATSAAGYFLLHVRRAKSPLVGENREESWHVDADVPEPELIVFIREVTVDES